MLDRIDARAQRRIDAVGAMRVRHRFAAERMRGLDDGVHLFLRELLADARRRVGEHAAGGDELDDVGAALDHFAHRAPAIVGAVAFAGRCQQRG